MRYTIPAPADPDGPLALRRDILGSAVDVGLHRARVFTEVFGANEGAPWIVCKAMALRRYLETVPLYLRPHDRIAGSISERPGAMPVMVEIGIAENTIYTSENPEAAGYLDDCVPADIDEYWVDRNLWGRYRAYLRTVRGVEVKRTRGAMYKFLSLQGHLSPSYAELLRVGLGGLLDKVRERACEEHDPAGLEFLGAAEHALLGVSTWARRYAELLGTEAAGCQDADRAAELESMAETAAKVAIDPPETFREAMQLIWFCQQAIHIEGHGYSNTPDRLDQLLYPFYLADKERGRLTDGEALTLCENFILKQRDNTFWGIEHSLTQGLVVSGSTPDGEDQTNELSWLLVAAADRMAVPDPLVWIRWHPNTDQDFFDFCLQTLAGRTCFPLMMSDTAVPAMLMSLGVAREDAFNYVPAGCNELAIPGQAYFNPGAHVGYLKALELALTGGTGYRADGVEVADLPTFDDLLGAVGEHIRRQIEQSYHADLPILVAQMRWGQSPFTSCFFDGCVERARDLVEGTKYNIRSCGGTAFANMVDSLAAIREVVYEQSEATLAEVVAACKADFEGYEPLRKKLLAAPKHGNDDPRLDDLVERVEQLRDEPMRAVCRDPRDGTPYGNCHVVRSSHVTAGRVTPATPDGRRAGRPLADSVAGCGGTARSGPTAVLGSILRMDPIASWQSGYNVNLRLQRSMLAEPGNRDKVRTMLNAFFAQGGQEMQINCVDTATLRAAQERPDEHRDMVVRVAGFSAFFVDLRRDIQDDIIARVEHAL